jgi:hypothetical protein
MPDIDSPAAQATATDAEMVDRTDPRAATWGPITGVWAFGALYAMVELGVVEHLADGPLSAPQLAERCHALPDRLARLLRTLTAMRFLERTGQEYALTEAGFALHSQAPGSMRWAVLSIGDPGSWPAIIGLPEAIRDGQSPFTKMHGSLYDYLRTRPDQARVFNEFMMARSRDTARALVDCYDFSGVKTIADIGGGAGIILAAILGANPALNGVLLDRGDAVEAARGFLSGQGLADRCTIVDGDYFDHVPAGADRYLLANIIHNLNDDDAVRVLSTVRTAMGPRSRLVAIDMLLPPEPDDHVGHFLDLRMMTVFDGGKERIPEHYRALLIEAGLRLTGVTPLAPTPMSVLEAVAAKPQEGIGNTDHASAVRRR